FSWQSVDPKFKNVAHKPSFRPIQSLASVTISTTLSTTPSSQLPTASSSPLTRASALPTTTLPLPPASTTTSPLPPFELRMIVGSEGYSHLARRNDRQEKHDWLGSVVKRDILPYSEDVSPLEFEDLRRSAAAALSSLSCAVISKQKSLREAGVESEECRRLARCSNVGVAFVIAGIETTVERLATLSSVGRDLIMILYSPLSLQTKWPSG
ncbi:hypothetical protein V5O48_016628, partial [Marasmius crinis-equi]